MLNFIGRFQSRSQSSRLRQSYSAVLSSENFGSGDRSCNLNAFLRRAHTITPQPGTEDSINGEDASSKGGSSNLQQLVHHLERTSLVDFESAEALKKLSEAIRFADQLFEVNTEGVEPLVTVLENESLHLRDDKPEPTRRQDILKNSSVTEEDYFVAPPGNIPLEQASKAFLQDDLNEKRK